MQDRPKAGPIGVICSHPPEVKKCKADVEMEMEKESSPADKASVYVGVHLQTGMFGD